MLVDPVLLELAEVPREVEVDDGQDRDQEEHQVLPHVGPSHDLQSEEIQSFTFPPHLFPERARARARYLLRVLLQLRIATHLDYLTPRRILGQVKWVQTFSLQKLTVRYASQTSKMQN